ncbi:UNVERIFIED_CONTAM: hypothetical protein HDU68_011293 [Siphonaria sp. JEL0065]|nr:hypothetical protein HDU68_011293 [Siphonaria sp. JEL0065]
MPSQPPPPAAAAAAAGKRGAMPQQSHFDEAADPEGGGFALDFGDESFDNGNNYSASNNNEGDQQQQQTYAASYGDSYNADPWFSNTDQYEYKTNDYEEQEAQQIDQQEEQQQFEQHQVQEQYSYGYADQSTPIDANGNTYLNKEKSPKPGPAAIKQSSIPPPVSTGAHTNGKPMQQHTPLAGTVGHPMYGSNVTFTPVSNGLDHSEDGSGNLVGLDANHPDPHTVGIVGSNIDDDQYVNHQANTSAAGHHDPAFHNESFIETNIVASYKWPIPNFADVSDEKIVSPPFGSSDHPWQMVVYPRGTAESVGTHLSAFLRPLKTIQEISEGDDWFRPVRRFVIRVHRPVQQPQSSYGDSEDEPEESFSYTISPSHSSAQEVPDDVLFQDFSVPTEFNGFATYVPGWGFKFLLPLSDLDQAIDTNTGSLTLSASVESLSTVPWTTQIYSWVIPGIQDQIASETPTLVSPSFGPSNSQWTIHLNPDYTAQTLSAFLQPSLNSNEAQASNWSRSISSFTLKIQSPQSEFGYTHSPSHVNSKTLTGGYIFTPENLSTGWPALLTLDQVPGCVDSQGILRVDVEVTWISATAASASLNATATNTATIASTTTATATTINGISEEDLLAKIAQVEAEWESKIEAILHEKEQLTQQISSLETEVAEAKEEASKEGDKVLDLKEELLSSREREHVITTASEKVKVFKAKMAILRAGFEDGVEVVKRNEDGFFTESKVGMHLRYSEKEQKDNFFVLKAKAETLETDLATAQEKVLELSEKLADTKIFGVSERPPSPSMHRRMSFMNDGLEAPIALAEALENATKDLENARQSVDEFYQRGAYSNDVACQVTEKSAALADISMYYAELALTRATLFDSCINYEPQEFPTNNPDSQVSIMIFEIESLMAEVDYQVNFLKPSSYNQTQNFHAQPYSPYSTQKQMMSPSHLGQQLSINTQQQHQPYEDQQHSHPSQEFQNKLHEQALQIEHFKTQAETLAQELATKNRLDQLKAQAQFENAGSPGFPSSVLSSPGAMRGVMKFGSIGALPRGRGDVIPEPWTPEGKDGGPVSAAELAKLLATIQNTSSTKHIVSIVAFLMTFLTAAFLSYATLHVHCHPASPQANSLLCQTTVPIYQSLSVAWHTAAQKFVSDVVPYTSNTLSSATQNTLHVLDQVDKKVKKDWERAERERVAKLAMEKEKWELEKQAKESQLKIELLEKQKIEELKVREREMIEKWESEKREKEAKVEAERRLQEENAKKHLEDWLASEKRKAAEKLEEERRVAVLAAAALVAETAAKESEKRAIVVDEERAITEPAAASTRASSASNSASSSSSSSISSRTTAAASANASPSSTDTPSNRVVPPAVVPPPPVAPPKVTISSSSSSTTTPTSSTTAPSSLTTVDSSATPPNSSEDKIYAEDKQVDEDGTESASLSVATPVPVPPITSIATTTATATSTTVAVLPVSADISSNESAAPTSATTTQSPTTTVADSTTATFTTLATSATFVPPEPLETPITLDSSLVEPEQQEFENQADPEIDPSVPVDVPPASIDVEGAADEPPVVEDSSLPQSDIPLEEENVEPRDL